MYWDKVAQRLVHLLPLDAKQPSVHPILCKRPLSGQSLSLRDLSLMMRKYQLGPSPVQIVGWAKMRECYRGVFVVLAWLSLAAWPVPVNLSRLLVLPEVSAGRVPFVGIW